MKKIKQKSRKETKTIEKIIKIEGMSCLHYEARVKKVLEELDSISEVLFSYT